MPDELQHEINFHVLGALESLRDLVFADAEIDKSVVGVLQALALQADRYDSELAEIRDGMAALDYRLKVLEHGPSSSNVTPLYGGVDRTRGSDA